MKPEDVPDDLLSLYGRNYMGSSPAVAARRAMAAVIPEIERWVREQVAREIETGFGDLDPADDYVLGVMHAAKRAREGESR